MYRSRKGQAILELAILGSLIITAFSILIGYSEKYNREQSYMQQTFRATLAKAKESNYYASVSTSDFRRMPNVANPMEIGALQNFGSGNTVLWSDGKMTALVQDSMAKAYFRNNRGGYINIPPSPAPGPQAGDISVSFSNYSSNLVSSIISNKDESGGNIGTTKALNATDSVGGSASVGPTTVFIGGVLGPGGRYIGGGLSRSTENTVE